MEKYKQKIKKLLFIVLHIILIFLYIIDIPIILWYSFLLVCWIDWNKESDHNLPSSILIDTIDIKQLLIYWIGAIILFIIFTTIIFFKKKK